MSNSGTGSVSLEGKLPPVLKVGVSGAAFMGGYIIFNHLPVGWLLLYLAAAPLALRAVYGMREIITVSRCARPRLVDPTPERQDDPRGRSRWS